MIWTKIARDFLDKLQEPYKFPWRLYIRPSKRFVRYLERRLK